MQAWIEIHQEDLTADWQLAANGQPIFKIEAIEIIMKKVKVSILDAQKAGDRLASHIRLFSMSLIVTLNHDKNVTLTGFEPVLPE